ncbi:MAG: hypothetical protein ACRD2F_01625 [Terriglobales bacterium]
MMVDTLDPDDDGPDDLPEDDLELSSEVEELAAPSGEDLRLRSVDMRHRAEVGHFQRSDEAEFAAGMLRANGIPAEVQAMMIPGLTADLALWVPQDQEELARRLLREAEEGDFAG